jgi:hypothetical protein
MGALEEASLLEIAEVAAHARLGNVEHLAQVGDPDGLALLEHLKNPLLSLLSEHSTIFAAHRQRVSIGWTAGFARL